MAGFRGKDWAQQTWRKVKASVPGKAQWHNLTDSLLQKGTTKLSSTKSLIVHNKKTILLGAGILVGVGSVIFSGYSYVKANTIDVYRVQLAGEEIGLISQQEVYETYKQGREQMLAIQYPNVHMELPAANSQQISFTLEKLFQPEVNDEALLAILDEKLPAQAYGAELRVDGKLIGYVKDEVTAGHVLDNLKISYTEKKSDQVVSLAADTQADIARSDKTKEESVTVEKVEFVEKIEVAQVKIEPQDVIDPEAMLQKLLTGDVAPYKYKVVAGDTLSQIAQRFKISMDVIYARNPQIVDDKIREGDELDLTVLHPALSVRIEETHVEEQEMAFETEVVKDESMRAGTSKVIQEGKSGSKKMTFKLTRINGYVVDEQLLDEQVLVEPVKQIVKKGTFVVKDEGSGKFAWPIYSARITSAYGMRWGKLHKGLDMIGNQNIMASDNGVVEQAGFHRDYGNYVIINHKNGYKTVYMHMSKLLTKRGATVQKGDKIGIMGDTGQSFGKHLHFEIHKNGVSQNPLKFLNK